jgi:hypothetical protein
VFYSGIGSRETPKEIQQQMVSIGKFLVRKGYVLRSGGASGADSAFEKGCDLVDGKKEIYLPWKKYNRNTSPLHFDIEPMLSLKNRAFEIAEQYHPIWADLKDAVKRLHARNVFQVLGLDLKTPCEFVICWTKIPWAPGVNAGGTSQALRIAQDKGIKIVNLLTDDPINFLKGVFDENHS